LTHRPAWECKRLWTVHSIWPRQLVVDPQRMAPNYRVQSPYK
jgi:hypothetical protein